METGFRCHILVGTALGLLIVAACSGSMEETSATTATDETITSTDEGAGDLSEQDEGYYAQVTSEILSGWEIPGRDSNTPPRSARVVVFFHPDGRVLSWEWRRRSSNGMFNDSVREHLNTVVESSQVFALPPAGTPLRHRVMNRGVVVDFSDVDG